VAAASLSLAWGESCPAVRPAWVASALGLGLASAFLQLTVNWALRTVPATRATLIFALEPVWAGMIGAAAGERMGPAGVAGAGMIVAAIAVSGLRRT
jgi:drug/metabolite transporter (DMT)-like permease